MDVVVPPGESYFTVRREFAAPRELVFECHTKPEHLRRWWGPRNGQMLECTVDFRVGGAYRFVLVGADGRQDGFHGEFKEIDAPARVVSTFVYEPYAQFPALQTQTFEQVGDITVVTARVEHLNVFARDGHVGAGMEVGMAETFERLDELLLELRA